jgi:hypothetical protein
MPTIIGAIDSRRTITRQRLQKAPSIETAIEGQSLAAEDHLFILMQAALYLSATRGMAAPEVRICYERAESLCHFLNRPQLLYLALAGRWRHSNTIGKLAEALQTAERIYALGRERNDFAQMLVAHCCLAVTLYFHGDLETARRFAIRGVEMWRSGNVPSYVGDIDAPGTACLVYGAMCDWHLGEIASCKASMKEAISLSKEQNDMHGLASALNFAANIAYLERDCAELQRLTSDLIELSTRHHFAHWLALGFIHRGSAYSASGDGAEGISWIENGIRAYRATGAMVGMPYLLGLKAQALYLAGRTSEALETIKEAEALAERSEQRVSYANLHRLRGVFLTAMGADESEIEASFCEAIRIAKEQKSVSIEKRAEATYAEYRRQKASGSGGRGFRLPLW